jgi:hypothetical protein
MYEYTAAYLTPFNWAKQAYDYMLGNVPNKTIDITKESSALTIEAQFMFLQVGPEPQRTTPPAQE